MKLKGSKFTEGEVSQEFDLKEILGIKQVDDSLAEAMGQAIIDRIVSRTEGGKGVDGKKLQKYSKSYSESLEFKAFGKKVDQVNMTLTGDMLSSLTITKIKNGKITVGWQDSENNIKAFAHNEGAGHVPKRPFFGLTEAETSALRDEFLPSFEDEKTANDATLIDKINALLGG